MRHSKNLLEATDVMLPQKTWPSRQIKESDILILKPRAD